MDHNPPPPPYSEIPIVRPKKYRALTTMPPPPYYRPRRRKRVTLADDLHTLPDEYIPAEQIDHHELIRLQITVDNTETFKFVVCYRSQFRSSYYLVFVFHDNDKFRIHSSELAYLFKAGRQFMNYIRAVEKNHVDPDAWVRERRVNCD
eukprot:402865_1